MESAGRAEATGASTRESAGGDAFGGSCATPALLPHVPVGAMTTDNH